MQNIEKKRAFIINVAFYLLCIFLAYVSVKYLIKLFLPLIIGLGVGVLVRKPVRWLIKRTNINSRYLSVILVLVIMITAGLVLIVAGKLLLDGVISLLSDFPDTIEDYLSILRGRAGEFVEQLKTKLPDNWDSSITEIVDKISKDIKNISMSLTSGMINMLVRFTTSCLPELLVTFAVTIVSIFFVSMDFDKIYSFVRRQIPEKAFEHIWDIKSFFCKTLISLARAYLILMLITFVQLAIGFMILRLKNAITLAFLIAVLDALPIIGTGTILIPWGIIAVVSGKVVFGISLLLIFLATIVVHNIVEPKIVGRSLGLHPLVTLTFMYAGLKTLGLIGLIVAPLTAILLKNLHDEGKIRIWK